LAELWNGLTKAVELIVSLDPEVMEIAGRSLTIAVTSTLLASLICLPLASLIHFNNFRGKRALVSVIQTFYSVPTVVIGLIVFVLFSRAGPLGVKGVDNAILDTARSLGASGAQTMVLVIKESRFAVIAAVIMGFSRAISEVGISLMVGGNIKGATRVITTAISLEAGKGGIELALALGIILIFIALVVNIVMNRVQQR